MAVHALQAAKLACEESGWTLSNLALQKILYIAHAAYLGSHDSPLIAEPFEAWMYGPVLPDVYHKTKIFGAKPIRNIFRSVDEVDVSSPEAQMIHAAVKRFKDMQPSALVGITHWDKGAWAKNYTPRKNVLIPNDDIKKEHLDRTS